jgi:hypothetical protein
MKSCLPRTISRCLIKPLSGSFEGQLITQVCSIWADEDFACYPEKSSDSNEEKSERNWTLAKDPSSNYSKTAEHDGVNQV